MGCNPKSIHVLVPQPSSNSLPLQEDAKIAHDMMIADIEGQKAIDEALARSLTVSSGGVDEGFGRMPQHTSLAELAGMLHVATEIGEHEIDMLVDTGAQMSVLSEPLAAQLGLLSRLDRRFQGMANGVGQAKILGKVFDVPVKLGHVEFSLNFSILSTQSHIILLGLDLLQQFKCMVDLERKCLVFGGSEGVRVPFVSSSRDVVTSPIDTVLAQGRRAAEMLRARDPVAASTVFRTLGLVLKNIVRYPNENKYRRLHGNNERLQGEVLAHPEVVELLRLVGFGSDGQDLVLPQGTPLTALHKLTLPGGLLG
jgi:predicted aspartyl protease